METPSSSTRRVTRSQTLAALSSNPNTSACVNSIPLSRKMEDSEKAVSKSRQRNAMQQDRSALIDITNDSPIVGLASGNLKTPLSSMAKQKVKNTPGSGEALLRGQVKTLLQKVEEEADTPQISMEARPFVQLVNSPMGILAPTPANTPQISNLSGEASVTPPVIEQSVTQEVNQGSPESEKNQITRSLLLDFSEKSEISDISECSSDLTSVEAVGGGKDKPSAEEDDASVWSMQVNASTHDEEEEEEEISEEEEEEEEEDYYEDIEEEEEYGDGGLLDELCEGLNKISVKEKAVPKFEGKHTRFVYNSDDELVGEEEEDDVASPSVLRLKGLPTPKGKHLRFPEEEEEVKTNLAL